MEKPKYSPEMQADLQAIRTLNDAELIIDGAEYKVTTECNLELEPT